MLTPTSAVFLDFFSAENKISGTERQPDRLAITFQEFPFSCASKLLSSKLDNTRRAVSSEINFSLSVH